MKWIKTLVALAGVISFVGSSALAADPQPQQGKKLTCCEEAHAKGKECSRKCCLAAHRQGKSCEKCNPHKEDAPFIKNAKSAKKAS